MRSQVASELLGERGDLSKLFLMSCRDRLPSRARPEPRGARFTRSGPFGLTGPLAESSWSVILLLTTLFAVLRRFDDAQGAVWEPFLVDD